MMNRRGRRRSPTLVCIFVVALLAIPFSIDARADGGKLTANPRLLWTFDTGG
jgi:hypothetical protein